jgi:hypothetical protein
MDRRLRVRHPAVGFGADEPAATVVNAGPARLPDHGSAG